MARIQLILPRKFIFKTDITVRASDLNYGGHVGNDTMLTLIQEARVRFYHTLGYKDEVSFEGSVGQIITDAAVQYKAEAFLSDVLQVQIAVSDFTKYGFDMMYLVSNKQTGVEVARAKTGIVCFDYNTRKISVVPTSLLTKLGFLY
jgi:YbgC/YbaW family acyl-CoA thioester hydrolase